VEVNKEKEGAEVSCHRRERADVTEAMPGKKDDFNFRNSISQRWKLNYLLSILEK